jgi:hypothetical protein
MRTRILFLLTPTILVTLAGNASAQTCNLDCDAPTAYHELGHSYWYEYSPDLSTCCYAKDGVTPSTLSCYGIPAYEFWGFSRHVTRTLTVRDPGSSHWEIEFRVDLDDPHQSYMNQLDVRLSVYHPATSSVTSYYPYYRNGSQGNDLCAWPYLDFTAQQGDIISIDFMGTTAGWSDSHVKIGFVRLSRITP